MQAISDGLRNTRVISKRLWIPATSGETTFWNNKVVGVGTLDANRLKVWGYKNPRPIATGEVFLRVLEMTEDSNFVEMFGEFGYPTRCSSLHLSQNQEVEFARRHREWIHPEPGIDTFFVTHNDHGFLHPVVVSIWRGDPKYDALGLGVREFSYECRFGASKKRRLVVPEWVIPEQALENWELVAA